VFTSEMKKNPVFDEKYVFFLFTGKGISRVSAYPEKKKMYFSDH